MIYTGWNFWESAASFIPKEPETPPHRPRSSLSNRMAISFPKPNQEPSETTTTKLSRPSALSHFILDDSHQNDNTVFSPIQTGNHFDNQYSIEDGNDSSDLEIEEDDDEDEEEKEDEKEIMKKEETEKPIREDEQADKKLFIPTATSRPPFVVVPNSENKASSFSMGRGRGMVKFGNPRAPGGRPDNQQGDPSLRKNLPIAKVSPTERNVDENDHKKINDNQVPSNCHNHGENSSENLSWRNNKNDSNPNDTFSSGADHQVRYQDYRSAVTNKNNSNNNNKKRQDFNKRSSNSSPKLNGFNSSDNDSVRDKNWRKSKPEKPQGSRYEPISGPPTITKGRFQPEYRPKTESTNFNNNKNNDDGSSTDNGFGTTKPKMCFRCSSLDHITEECSTNNFFF